MKICPVKAETLNTETERQTDRHDEAFRKSENAPKNCTFLQTRLRTAFFCKRLQREEKHLNSKLPNKMLENGKIPINGRPIRNHI
jgi:hypothetical protein